MKQRLLSLLLALALLLALLPGLAAPVRAEDEYAGSCGDKLTWRFDPDTGLLTIEGEGDMWDFASGVYVPGDGPWGVHRKNITALSLPEGLTGISDFAFADCAGLTSVTIPKGVTNIGWGAFERCYELRSLSLPEGLTDIGAFTFWECVGLTSVTIPEGVTDIGECTFWGCNRLTSVTIPGSVNSIGVYAFSNCSRLNSVTLQEGLTSIGDSAFSGCTMLTSITIPEGLTSIGDYAFADCAGLTSVTIPEGVTDIGECTFRGCYRLSAVKLPEGLARIEHRAFCGCTELQSVTLPNSLSGLGYGAFEGCTALRSVIVKNPECVVAEELALDNLSDEYLGLTSNSLGVPGSTVVYGAHSAEKENAERIHSDYGAYVRYAENYALVHGYKFFPTNAFSDVKEGGYYEIPVAWAVGMGITAGTGEGQFSPKQTCTREQIVTFLWKALGAPEPEASESPFSDVKPGKYYFKPVLWAVENGVTGGMGDGKFGVGRPCTREQAVSFLWKALGAPEPEGTESPFTDVKPGKYYYKPVLWAVENGVTGGVGDGKFGVGSSCTRAQIVTFLYKAFP